MARELRIEYLRLDQTRPDPQNPKDHDLGALASSFERFGFVAPGAINEETGTLIYGHGRLLRLIQARMAGQSPPDGIRVEKDGMWSWPVIRGISLNRADGRAYVLADNRLVELGGWADDQLVNQLIEMTREPGGLSGTGFDSDDLERMIAFLGQVPPPGAGPGISPDEAKQTLAQRFGVPPFSILDTRQGYWQERKRAWLALGIQSEIGRQRNLLKMSDTVLEPDASKRKAKSLGATSINPETLPGYYHKLREGMTREQILEEHEGKGSPLWEGTSIFDPVICELIYRWFSPDGASVLDPFAGGSVRGIVAAKLGRGYTGLEISSAQIKANRLQARKIVPEAKDLQWLEADATELGALELEPFDLIFSCPPYFDLERYSDDPRDLSNLEAYELFLEAYQKVISQAAALLKPHRFACFVVSEIRDDHGQYRGLVPDTIRAFREAGFSFYNDAILIQPPVTLTVRAGRIFEAGRKLGRCHQNVLVFFNGDPSQIRDTMGETEFGELGQGEETPYGERLSLEPEEAPT